MKNCPFCESNSSFYFKIFSRKYNRCIVCDLIFKDSSQNYLEILAPYRHEDYFSEKSRDQEERSRDKLYDLILDGLGKKRASGSVLDIGTGCGFFLAAARQRGWKVSGVEPSKSAVEYGRSVNKINVEVGTLQEYNSNSRFDVITFINVLDHSAEPWDEIRRAKNLLKANGILYLRFPNSFLHVSLYKLSAIVGATGFVRKYLVFHHFCFNPKFINRLLSESGFKNINISNSPPSEGDPHNLFLHPMISQCSKKLLFWIAEIVYILSSKKVLLGASLEVTATRSGS